MDWDILVCHCCAVRACNVLLVSFRANAMSKVLALDVLDGQSRQSLGK